MPHLRYRCGSSSFYLVPKLATPVLWMIWWKMEKSLIQFSGDAGKHLRLGPTLRFMSDAKTLWSAYGGENG